MIYEICMNDGGTCSWFRMAMVSALASCCGTSASVTAQIDILLYQSTLVVDSSNCEDVSNWFLATECLYHKMLGMCGSTMELHEV